MILSNNAKLAFSQLFVCGTTKLGIGQKKGGGYFSREGWYTDAHYNLILAHAET